ncbi:MAG: DUF1564 domain-containing protein [Leptospira sp.]|nr:DUF1564 domain-containing protein [Leptospira sp.]
MTKPNTEKKTQSSLLIPDRFLADFKRISDETGRDIYFHSLLKRYSPLVLSGFFGKRTKSKICYQKKENNLIKRNFNPVNSDWIEFGLLADYLGVSKTALFVMFLRLDIAGWESIVSENFFDCGVPPITTNVLARIHLKYSSQVTVSRKMKYRHRW